MQESKRTQKHRSTNNLCTYALVTCALTLAGCTQQHEVVTEQICVPDIDKAEALEVAEDVLAKMHFTIEKVDGQSGYIKTRPLAGAQFFEFWRSDNVGSGSSLQANLHTVRRTVELRIVPRTSRERRAPSDEELYIGCDVRVQRLLLPEREISSSARGYELFSTSSPTIQRLRLDPEQQKDMAWVDLGKDEQLATEILKRIEKRMQQN